LKSFPRAFYKGFLIAKRAILRSCSSLSTDLAKTILAKF